MRKNYDLIVLGAGNAGLVVARLAKNAGQSVLLVEARDVGGTCPLRGCVPKKVLVAAAETMEHIRLADKHHITVGPAKIDWAQLIDRRQSFVEGVPESFEKGLAKAGIDLTHGTARFTGTHSIAVNDSNYKAKKIVISTGSKPRALPIPGFEHALSSEEILEMRKQPESLVFIGAGVISMEFTHVLARAGTRVTVIELSDRPLPMLDPDLVEGLVEVSRDLGVKIYTSAKTQSIERSNGTFTVRFEHDGAMKSVTADAVANGAGRIPATDTLNLEAAKVETDKSGIRVDDYLRSVSNPDILVAGDSLGKGRALSPVASYEGKIVGHNLTSAKMIGPDYRAIPSVVFTIPPLASVGLTEADAKEKDLAFEIRFNNMKDWRSAKTYNEPATLAKVLVEKQTGKILGAHILGHGAPEIIHTLAFAIKFGHTSQDLKDFVYAYPTDTSDIRFMV